MSRVTGVEARLPAPGCRYGGGEFELYVLTPDWLYVSGGTEIYRNQKKVIQAANAWKNTDMRVFIVTKVPVPLRHRIEFRDVGRHRACWTERVSQQPTLSLIERLVRRKRVLMSRGIECVFSEGLRSGHIYAGIHTIVGSFELVTDEEQSHG